MSIEVVCSDCSATYRVKDSAAGKSLPCTECGALLSVPGFATPQIDRDGSSALKPLDNDELVPAGWAAAQDSTSAVASSQAKTPDFRRRRLELSTVLLAITLVVGTWVGGIFFDAVRSSSWPHVEGIVVRSNVIRQGKSASLQLLYNYQVNGTIYDSDQVTFAGNSPLYCGGPDAVTETYPNQAKVRVYYNPRNPASAALVTGVPTVLGFLILPLFLLGACCVFFAWSSYAESFGAPRPAPNPNLEDPRSVPQRVMIAVFGALLVLVFGGLAVMALTLPSTVPQSGRDTFGMVAATFAGLVFAAISLVIAWFGVRVFKSAFKRPETFNDLRLAPDSPKFSDSSLVCFSAGLGTSTGIILDREQGRIHFKRCFQPRGFLVVSSQPWMSCSLDDITGLSQMTYKGHTTFIIETRQGKASISPLIENFAELRQYLENRPLEGRQSADQRAKRSPKKMPVKTAYAPGQAPLDWRIGMCVVGGCFGPIVGLVVGFSSGSRDVGVSMLWGLILGGCSGLPFFLFSSRRSSESDNEDSEPASEPEVGQWQNANEELPIATLIQRGERTQMKCPQCQVNYDMTGILGKLKDQCPDLPGLQVRCRKCKAVFSIAETT